MKWGSIIISAAIVFAAPAMPRATEAAMLKTYSAEERAVIRSMPITSRPYRPGHFYGNTVRLLDRMGVWYGPR